MTSAVDGANLLQSPLVKELIICDVCNTFLLEPRMLPCQHSFCLKCIESVHEIRQADSHMKLGSIRCPTCRNIAAIPLSGIGAFPVDKKVDKVRDLVDEMLMQSILNKSIKEDGVSDSRSSNSSSPADFHAGSKEDVYGSHNSMYSSSGSLNAPKSTMHTQTDVSWEDLAREVMKQANGHEGEGGPAPSKPRRRRRRPKSEDSEDGHVESQSSSTTNSVPNQNGHEFMENIEEQVEPESNEQDCDNASHEPKTETFSPGSQEGHQEGMDEGDVVDSSQGDQVKETLVYDPEIIFEVDGEDYNMPTSLGFFSSGGLAVSEYGNNKLQFFDSDGKYITSYDDVKPFSLFVDNEDRVLVADRRDKTIKMFDEEGGLIFEWERDRFKWISGIAISRDWKYVICEREKCKIGIYEPEGGLIKEFGSHGNNDTQFSMADFLTVDSHDRIILCDSANHCVKLFDVRSGKFLGKFSRRGNRNGELEWPKSVCVDHMDNILVTDTRNNRVSMFNSDGEFIQHMIMDYPHPYGVAFSNGDPNLFGLTRYSLTGQSMISVFKVNSVQGSETTPEGDG